MRRRRGPVDGARIRASSSPALTAGRDPVAADTRGEIYGWGEEVESNAVEFLIHSLRRKLARMLSEMSGA